MKSIAVLVVLGLVAGSLALTDKQKAKGDEYAKACMQEGSVPAEEVARMKKGDFSNASQKVKCFANCVLEKAGMMKDGEFQESEAKKILSENMDAGKVQALVDSCKTNKGADKCETSFKLMECYAKKKAQLA